jgi:hypothetical protein
MWLRDNHGATFYHLFSPVLCGLLFPYVVILLYSKLKEIIGRKHSYHYTSCRARNLTQNHPICIVFIFLSNHLSSLYVPNGLKIVLIFASPIPLLSLVTPYSFLWFRTTGITDISYETIPHTPILMRNRDSSVGIATGWRARVRFPAEAKIFCSPQRPDWLWGPPILLSNGYRGGLSPEVKRQRREADHSTSSNDDVKNGGAIPPLPSTSAWSGA